MKSTALVPGGTVMAVSTKARELACVIWRTGRRIVHRHRGLGLSNGPATRVQIVVVDHNLRSLGDVHGKVTRELVVLGNTLATRADAEAEPRRVGILANADVVGGHESSV